MPATEVFDDYERDLFTRVVSLAEKEGKHVSLLVAPTNDVFESIVATAQRLQSSRVVCGLSNKLSPDEQGKRTGDAWERLPEPKPRITLEVAAPDGRKWEYQLGPHTPRLRQEDLVDGVVGRDLHRRSNSLHRSRGKKGRTVLAA